MKIAILGYGKMGKEVESIAIERKHQVPVKINSKNADQLSQELLQETDVAIEFSKAESAVDNIKLCIKSGIPVVVGTTAWYNQWNDVKKYCEEKNGSLLTATNFSVGVNLFFELNRKLAQLMDQQTDYKAEITEIHHTEKLDSPSGTAISLAEQIIDSHNAYDRWANTKSKKPAELGILSKREVDVKGTHQVQYESPIDRIKIEHFAKNRKGFALGAVLAAEFLQNKKGIFKMKDVLKF